jgi:hypothetical protein
LASCHGAGRHRRPDAARSAQARRLGFCCAFPDADRRPRTVLHLLISISCRTIWR